MKNPIRIDKHHIPLEHVVLVEAFVPNPDAPLFSSRPFSTRIVLLNRDSMLTEQAIDDLAGAHGFRMLPQGEAAINPDVFFRVESFAPVDGFSPSRPFKSRLVWRDLDGNTQSKLLLAEPEAVLALIVDGVAGEAPAGPANERISRPKSRRKRARTSGHVPG
jgi:hypothetical protein